MASTAGKETLVFLLGLAAAIAGAKIMKQKMAARIWRNSLWFGFTAIDWLISSTRDYYTTAVQFSSNQPGSGERTIGRHGVKSEKACFQQSSIQPCRNPH
jgi:hypothetical protein